MLFHLKASVEELGVLKKVLKEQKLSKPYIRGWKLMRLESKT